MRVQKTVIIYYKMCWNSRVSMNTFLISTFAVLLAYGNGNIDFFKVAFFMSFISLQFIEFMIWDKTLSNRLVSQIGLFLIMCQPILSILLINNKKIIIPVLLCYAIFLIILFTFICPLQNIDFRSIKAKNGHLSWKWLSFPIVVILIWMGFLLFKFIYNKEWILLAFMIILVLSSLLLFYKTETWGSMWCWVSNVIAIYLIYKIFANEFCLTSF